MAVRVSSAKLSGLSERFVKIWAKKAAQILGRPHSDIAVIFVDAKKIRSLNRQYRRQDKATDVLSFPADSDADLGDIFIAPAVAQIKARARGMDDKSYLTLLIVHSVLHLGGYDHHTSKGSKAMEKMEKKILK